MSGAWPDIVCRDADSNDLAAIIALLADDELGSARNPLLADAEDAYRAAFVEILASPDNGYVVAVGRAGIVGCYQLTFIRGLSFTGGLRAQIESVRIASALRGRGLGTALMQDAVRRARGRGAFLVQLTTDHRRTHTRRFYERLGFEASHHGMKLRLS
jgi:ribosomal protein S18 acetylase RimI-like enzyme